MCAPISLATASTAEQDTSGPAPTHVLCAPTRKEKPKTIDDRGGDPADTMGTVCTTQCTTASGCEACTGVDNECVNCRGGYRWLGSTLKTCGLCENGKGSLVDTDDKLKPNSGAESCTLDCSPGCNVCTGADASSLTDCLNCAAGYFWAGSAKCTLCSGKKGKGPDDTDKTGDSALTNDGACITGCTSGCNACTGTASECLNCRAGYFWAGSATCTLCSLQKGKAVDDTDKTGLVAESCGTDCTKDSGCDACEGNGTNCLNCRAGYFWNGGKSCKLCSGRRGKLRDSDEKTGIALVNDDACDVQCALDKGCEACTGDQNVCINCRAGYFWQGSDKCKLCSGRTGKDSDEADKSGTAADASTVCSKDCDKSAGCEACHANGTTCLNCRAGFAWDGRNGQKKCNLCGDETGTGVDDTDRLALDNAQETCGTSCTGGCNVCTDIASNCINCRAGYFWAGSNTCSLCSDKKGKAKDD